MAAKIEQYKLRCNLIGHSLDIRAVATSEKGEIVTASRDITAKLWVESESNRKIYEEKITYIGHSGYVTSICLILPTEDYPEGLTATGSRDTSILVFPRYSSDPIHVLTGHSDTVSCLSSSDGVLISGSWDHTIRLWKNWETTMELNGHEGPIWGLAVFSFQSECDRIILSASADKTIKSWKKDKVLTTYSGHTDCVRSLCIISEDKFLSCSNDAMVKLWQLSGTCLGTYYGHSNFIYSISIIESNGGFLTGGEDRTIRIWSLSGENVETLYVPTQSVWSVASLPNTDIVTGSSDGICRVFTQSLERQADENEQSEYEESVAKSKIAVEDLGGLKRSELPEKSVLHAPGKRDGQTIMVKDSDKVMCYNWSASKQQWEAVGEVVGGTGGSAGSSGKVLYNGREYDYVFDVDLDEGRMLKLPYNKTEDPWMVAQSFIHMHELPQDYLDQVAKFIYTNANVSAESTTSGYLDPFTGGSRYVPQGLGDSSQNGSGDPLTGGGRYVPPQTEVTFTSHFFPQKTPLLFESVNKSGILSKFIESNSFVSEKLSEDQIQQLVDCVTSQNINPELLSPLETALQWPAERIWPVLDVLRLALRFTSVHEKWLFTDKGDTLVGLLVDLLKPSSPSNTHLLSLRCLSNIAAHLPGRQLLARSRQSVVTTALQLAPFPNKNMEIAVATLMLNYSVIFNVKASLEDQYQVLSGSATLALSVKDSEAVFRTLVSLGTLICTNNDVKSFAQSLDLKGVINSLALSESLPKLCECAKHIMKIL